MKNLHKIINYTLLVLLISSCTKNIDITPVSNLYDDIFYKNLTEFDAALVGCYNGMQKPLMDEWALTELRSDNAIMGNPTSSSIPNRELSDLDLLIPATTHEKVYNYWLNSYYNIFNVNKVLSSLHISYDSSNAKLVYDTTFTLISDADRKRIAAQASFIRAYHYFNLVRLYGGVFLIDRPVTAAESKSINRSSVQAIYNLIIADLKNANQFGEPSKYANIAKNDLGRANKWAAQALLAKVYLTLNNKPQARILLDSVIYQSGYNLQPKYEDVFSTTNEMNSEILFAVRYQAGKVGLGSPFPNMFAPSSSGNAIVNGDGDGYNYPSYDLPSAYSSADPRKNFNIKYYGSKLYSNKYILYDDIHHNSPLLFQDDGENDWPVIRFADVKLMMAEVLGFSDSRAVGLINDIRTRVGLPDVTPTTDATFEQCLSNERRLEFAFENQRWFDMIRYNVTTSTITAENILKAHFAAIYNQHYASYLPVISLQTLQSYVTHEHLLLPIPQREIDNNTQLVIPQNPGY